MLLHSLLSNICNIWLVELPYWLKVCFFGGQHFGNFNLGEEITNANPKDSNVKDKSPKLTCYELLWISGRNGKKQLSICTKTDLCLSISISILLNRKGALFLPTASEGYVFRTTCQSFRPWGGGGSGIRPWMQT